MKIFHVVLAAILSAGIIALCRRLTATLNQIQNIYLAGKAILDLVARSPRSRLAVTIIGTVVVGVLTGVYAIQIAPNGVIAWSKLIQVSSFWPLVIVTAIWFLIHFAFLGRDQAIERFADDQHCVAFVRFTNLEAYARRVKADPTQARVARVVLEELGVKMQ